MTPSDLEQIALAVQAVEPRARLVSMRVLRRAIRRHLDLSAGAKAPHDFVFELPSSLVQNLVGDLAIDPGAASVVLLALPDDAEEISTDEALVNCWRRLFHAAVDRAIDQSGGSFADERRLFCATTLHEIRVVLESGRRLVPPDDERILFREFAALFLELHYFESHSLCDCFPGFLHSDEVARFLESRFGARALFEAARPPGAPDPGSISEHGEATSSGTSGIPSRLPSPAEMEHNRIKAANAAQKGNDVRAAICYAQMSETALADEKLRSLVQRLQKALPFDNVESTKWYEAVRPVLDQAAAHGFWNVGRRLLYELQKACLDVERKTYSVDAVEWLVSFGRQPIKRMLERPRSVNVLRRLCAAAKHLQRLSVGTREQLEHLLHDAIAVAEIRVRDENRPILDAVLDDVGIVPENQAERISRCKVVEELLDTLCSRGYIKMSDLRDAIARNRVKLDDLSGPKEFFTGDPLIRANRQLALRLDGVYRRGEIYMRGLQRLSSLGFGTQIGRLLVLWLILPFAASFVILNGVHEIAEILGKVSHALEKVIVGGNTEPVKHAGHVKPWLTSDLAIVLMAVFLLGLIHAPAFRRQVARWSRIVLVDLPSAIYHSPVVRGLFNNAATRYFIHYLLLPLLVGAAALLVMRWLKNDWKATLLVGGGLAVLTATLFRTTFGRALEERLAALLSHVWHVVSVNFIIGVLSLVLQFFRWLFEWMERGMYAVDEWLRFKEGESKATLTFKVVFGFFWFFFTYLFRFAWNLLIEPQINPIKHFPVVTVSHKLILPTALTADFDHHASSLAEVLMGPFDLSIKSANTVASTVVWGIPGIFGFLVWELKENWKLYKANRSPVIGAIAVGTHGERVRGLLRPGFHSGVVPKTFAKLRRALSKGNRKKAAKHHHHLEHVAEAVERLAERELIAYLNSSRRWGGLPIHVAKIALATNRIRVILAIQQWERTVIIAIEERGGWLIASIEDAGWLAKLGDKQRAAFVDTLTELYKLSGVHVVREQAAALLGVEGRRIDCRPEGLLVLPKTDESPVTIDYTDDPEMIPRDSIDDRVIPPLIKSELVLTDRPIHWETWVERWEQDQAGKGSLDSLLARYRVI